MAGALFLGTSYLALGTAPFSFVSDGSGDGGTITINVERSVQQCAPDSVRFTVDLSAATFDTQGPNTGAGEIYDARMHDLIFIWEFDDAASGNWTAPEKTLSAWKNRNVAYGPFVAHMYTSHGTYNPSVLVIEPSSGKTATAQLTGVDAIDVLNPDDVYSGTDTILVNPVGDTDFTDFSGNGAPATENTDYFQQSDAAYSNHTGSGPKRFLFKRGASYDLKIWSGIANVLFGAYGDPADPLPIMNGVATTDQKEALFYGQGTDFQDFRIENLDLRGPYDPTTTVNLDVTSKVYGVRMLPTDISLMISNVSFDGVQSAVCSLEPSLTAGYNVHLDNVSATNFGDNYPLFGKQSDDTSMSWVLTGCRIAQPGGAHDTNLTAYGSYAAKATSTHSPIRLQGTPRTHMRGCDFFHTDRVHSSLRVHSTPGRDGGIINIHSMALEGGYGALTIGGDPTLTGGLSRAVVGNIIIDGIIHVGGRGTSNFLETFYSGYTLRNCIQIVTEVPRSQDIAHSHFIKQKSMGTFGTEVSDAPIRVFNNTFVFLRTLSENISVVPVTLFDESSGFTNKTIHNNVRHLPNLGESSETTFSPLTTTALFTPRDTGMRLPDSIGTLDTSYAHPAAEVAYYRPGSGSIALDPGATDSLVSYKDAERTTRGDPAADGWLEGV